MSAIQGFRLVFAGPHGTIAAIQTPMSRRLTAELIAGLLLAAGVCGVFWILFTNLDTGWSWRKTWEYRQLLFNGWLVTIALSAGALPGSCLVAALLLLGQKVPLQSVRWLSRGIVEFVRGMPLLALLLIGYYVLFAQSHIARAFELVGLGSKLASGIVLLSVFTGAYLSEILRGGLESIPQAQRDSARAVGFDRWQVLRYVVFPQALRRVLPAIAGQFVSLVKDSSLLCVIGIQEFTAQARAFNSATYGGIEAFLPLAIGYLILTLPIAGLARWMERRFRRETAS